MIKGGNNQKIWSGSGVQSKYYFGGVPDVRGGGPVQLFGQDARKSDNKWTPPHKYL